MKSIALPTTSLYRTTNHCGSFAVLGVRCRHLVAGFRHKWTTLLSLERSRMLTFQGPGLKKQGAYQPRVLVATWCSAKRHTRLGINLGFGGDTCVPGRPQNSALAPQNAAVAKLLTNARGRAAGGASPHGFHTSSVRKCIHAATHNCRIRGRGVEGRHLEDS